VFCEVAGAPDGYTTTYFRRWMCVHGCHHAKELDVRQFPISSCPFFLDVPSLMPTFLFQADVEAWLGGRKDGPISLRDWAEEQKSPEGPLDFTSIQVLQHMVGVCIRIFGCWMSFSLRDKFSVAGYSFPSPDRPTAK
jgi:hypothetical protein